MFRAARTAVAFGLGAGIAAACMIAYLLDPLESLEQRTFDLRMQVRGERDPPRDIVIVGIDEETLRAGPDWPFPRSMHARVLDRLRTSGARAIAFDVAFSDRSSRREDEALARAITRAGNVVLAIAETTSITLRGGRVARVHYPLIGGDSTDALRARPGHTVLVEPLGAVARRAPYEFEGVRGIGVAVTERIDGRRIAPAELGPQRDPPDAVTSEPGRTRSFWIDFAGGAGTIPTIPYLRVFRGQVPPRALRDKVVVIGGTTPVLQDIHRTPFGDGMSGAELHANEIATALAGFPLQSAPRWADLCLIMLLALTPPAASLVLRLGPALALSLLVLACFTLAAQMAFNAGTVVSVVYPSLALLLGVVAAVPAYQLARAFMRARNLFGRFVPADVAEDLISRGGSDPLPGGQTIDATVMFCDLRGFTSFTESEPADRVISALNEYLGRIADSVIADGGAVVSFTGDGLMAVFGAPNPDEHHADNAVRAARRILETDVPGFNRWLKDAGHDAHFRVGIGLNSGPVISGYVGSRNRLEYAAIGDPTNTAARIEALTKDEEYQLLLSGATRARLNHELPSLVRVGERPIRGRVGRIELWSLDEPSVRGQVPANP